MTEDYPSNNNYLECHHTQEPKACFLFFSLCYLSHPFHGSHTSLPPSPLSMNTLFSTPEHAQNAPSCEEMSDVYHPPSSLPNMHACSNTHKAQGDITNIHQTCTRIHTCSLPLTQHSGGNLISQRVYGIDICFSLVLVLLVWHSLAHARETTKTPWDKPITFPGYRETWGVKESSFVPLLPLWPPIFFLLLLSGDLFKCSWGLATVDLVGCIHWCELEIISH